MILTYGQFITLCTIIRHEASVRGTILIGPTNGWDFFTAKGYNQFYAPIYHNDNTL